jgi:hypothetical protein
MNIVMRELFTSKFLTVNATFVRPLPSSYRGVLKEPCGTYGEIGGHGVGLFVAGAQPCLVIDGQAFDWDLHQSRVSWQQQGEKRTLEIIDIRPNGIEFRVNYIVTDVPVNISWPETEEDVDFGLWLSNVINSPERRQALINNNQSRISET